LPRSIYIHAAILARGHFTWLKLVRTQTAIDTLESCIAVINLLTV
jgi:hypothetical protein